MNRSLINRIFRACTVPVVAVLIVSNLSCSQNNDGVSSSATDPSIFRGSLDRSGYFDTRSPSKGKLKWKAKVGEDGSLSPALLQDGTLYVGSYDSEFAAIDAETGNQIWAYQGPSSYEGRPTLGGGMVFFGGNDGKMHALDTLNGRKVWETDFGYSAVYAAPLYLDGLLLCGISNGLRALSVMGGRSIWEPHPSIEGFRVLFSPAQRGERVFITKRAMSSDSKQMPELLVFEVSPDHAKKVASFSSDDYEERMSEDGHGRYPVNTNFSAPTLWKDNIFVSTDENLYVLDALSCQELWRLEFEGGGHSRHPPAFSGDMLYCIEFGETISRILAIDINHRRIDWTLDFPGVFLGRPVATNDMLFVGCGKASHGEVYAVDLKNHSVAWTFVTDGYIQSEILVHNGIAFVGDGQGNLYALE